MMTFGANRCLTIKTKKEMKKNLFMVAAVALMAMISCNKEEINNIGEPQEPQTPEVVEPSYYVEFTADLGAEETVTPTVQQSATRTTIDVANKKTLWVEGDAISVNGKKFVVKELIDGGLSARFVNEGELGTDFKAPYTAKYPYKANGTIEIPASQTAVKGSIDPAYVPALAYSDDNSLKFKHAASLLKFQVPAACEQVVLSADDALAGTLTETLPEEFDGEPTFTAATKSVTVKGSFVTGQDYYAAVLPGTKKNFVVRIDGYLSKNAASVNIARSNIVNMKTLPAAVASEWCVKGSFDNWGEGFSLFNDLNGNIVAKNIKLSGAFKIVNPSDKYVRSISNNPTTSKWLTLYDASGDMSLTGTYDVYVNTANKAICMVTASSSVPEFKLSNRELYVSVQSGWGWPYLYGWEGTNTELWGGWQARKYDTSLTISNTGYYCWMVPANFNNKTVSLIASKSGEQAPTKSGVALTQDRFYELKYTNKVEFNEVTAPTF